METIHQLFLKDKQIHNFVDQLKNREADGQLVTGLTGSARPALIQTIFKETKKSIYIISSNLLQAQKLVDDLSALIGEEWVHYYPAEEFIAANMTISSPELRAQRIAALGRLINKERGIYIIPAAGMRKMLNAPSDWVGFELATSLGQDVDINEWLHKLVEMGYSRSEMVTTPGEFAMRGGILDIYPPYAESPIRIELFDTEVDSIRTFSADDQRSIEKLDQVKILPATELLITSDHRLVIADRLEASLATSLKKVRKKETQELLIQNIAQDIELLRQGHLPDHIAKYGSLLFDKPHFLGDYFAQDGLVLFDELGRIQEVMEAWEREESEWFVSLIEEGKMLHEVKPSYALKEILAMLTQQKVYFALFTRSFAGVTLKKTTNFSCKPMQQFHGQIALLQNEIERWTHEKFTVLFTAQTNERIKAMQILLEDYHIPATIGYSDGPGIYLVNTALSVGFELPLQKIAVVTDDELFKQQAKKKTRPQKMSNAERIKSYTEIKPGDYVVHVHHGIGKYIGIETLVVNNTHQDYLHVRYREDDKLFVPVDQIELIQRYVPSGEKEPKLHKLGGAEWKKTRAKVSSAVQDIADDLIKLYAKREAEKGFSFSPDSDEQRSFEAAFPYEETDDQLRTIVEVKRDMERERPMDRLVCGDVGYGKTEVAIRAAFKAILDGKQVAFLVPTTILAQQHYETISKRFEDHAINVGLLSRFRSKKQQTETIKGLREGTVDIVIGTHRVLSKDVAYHDLGLLVVDEEQRFGVTHKEKIKQLRTNVDVLTLTATPIPRTLHMSMVGVRDLSVIETPPQNRFPVQTYVMEHNGALVREAIEREMARGGQTFYLYNRVEDITRRVEEIQMLVPDARVAYAHGQMTEAKLESVILSFIEGEYDVLVTTTIIETGVDIPNVNTLIVHDADRMGLSQLYQLRGRVGRSNRIAYAYFMYERDKVLTEVAESRLQAVKEFTELGSGFKIAMRDLSIRGAGNLLGAQQHGFIDSVGFDLYSQMLEEAVEERRSGVKKEEKTEVEIVLHVDAYIPDAYIPDGYQKIQMYKRIKSMEKMDDYMEIIEELQDRFGDLPVETERLMRIARMKVWAAEAGVLSIKEKQLVVSILLSEEGTAFADGAKIVAESMIFGRAVGFGMEGKQLIVTVDYHKCGNHLPFDVIEQMMEIIATSKKA
ncbi:transcription-repair coupling factor [Lysinibacillus sp. 2017]|uniref:transcription-repair coupling factor n=1 Tax=unclassified Lysinibacillus TaxID=2636778 RepID=UPI000D525DC9|nr:MULTISPECIES: transcription-repair coupling factor [unclassified Lysinibacillus]AWE05955.1 transcription-repair coupling factor [Lysinibacillus sp. 2017]TGN33449.1 transcription-repair coupling factor [Lysinibacillus sp. S2017]